ncbi:ROK family transcriptional regulator [Gracilibacillus caseinilyticus]|uniref:ROK family transcriptional regulator n=1 Tax=Gracilibacillus caseinilyticus TaxID=2932256 RepID=A0ABY4F1Y6_9BACI|nr:ROK family transcriptional regulator [Gracilibacillus caseinilyticus]UOQ50548.1 ROK family transcriptional regulator [Gracilibacillus caseinilyticus]
MLRGSFQWMKSLNKSIILNKIRTSGSISRAQIAKETQLTPPTVGTIVKELLEQGLIKESQLGASQGGRKPTMLVLNTTGFYIIGIDVGPEDIQFVISDLSGDIIDEQEHPLTTGIQKQAFLQMLVEVVTQLTQKHDSLQFIGIGVAMHGVVDADQGISIFAPNLNLRDVAIKQHLEAHFDMDVKVENDAKALALGEAWFENKTTHRSMIAVNVGRGIGAGIVIDGKLFSGEHGIAGEIGHMTIDLKGKRCTCGNDGCLQTVASGPAIGERAMELLAEGNPSLLEKHSKMITAEMVHQAAVDEDQLAKNILEEAGNYLGIALTNLIHVCNPSSIIIGGGVAQAGEFILAPIVETIQTRTISDQAQQTPVSLSNLGQYGSALGAVALILSELFEPNMN